MRGSSDLDGTRIEHVVSLIIRSNDAHGAIPLTLPQNLVVTSTIRARQCRGDAILLVGVDEGFGAIGMVVGVPMDVDSGDIGMVFGSVVDTGSSGGSYGRDDEEYVDKNEPCWSLHLDGCSVIQMVRESPRSQKHGDSVELFLLSTCTVLCWPG